MAAPIPIWDFLQKEGEHLASVPGDDEDSFASMRGLTLVADSGEWVAPRVGKLIAKQLRVEDLDDEELQRGQVRDADGRFRGRPSQKVPRQFHDELMRRILERGSEELRGNYMNAVNVMVDLMNDTNTDDNLRANLAKFIVERLGGKTPDRVEAVVAIKPWETVMDRIIKEIPEEGFVYAELEEDESEPI